ncbi:diacylglycerol kinase (ATP) [Breznakia sp. PH1-1]|nr:diacylglycerol kinase (ATP) [Breznakia sp. PH1-1]MDH6403204.1 diacylglycerol kinase (ATP) [Breznakia sp. PF1-11]MDH6410913.1 diacylglycerol kinase (ATP) [Breznakia sp. PFB1-11]MDH6413030.1 diacylglycerol kinase (ATP) [Breznakia sp. PFB1-14]MDH6415398.1 diacylglycerol kinase (ATP) [Breznakia sp. PFB1-4]MDH6417697.1 diacylglycerol kinase (ATP) [Breznakia sp. PFB1-12]MDH6473084.1 diacylglycerol kinase (ATP) [Breznakia sp. PFB2-30]MDH6475138.1 diacylglycerol kinase (ATP) [Breznakia sp. PFB1-1
MKNIRFCKYIAIPTDIVYDISMKKILFVYNPVAGKGNIKNKLSKIIEAFSSDENTLITYATKANNDAYHHIVQFGQQFDRIICSGGDGTLNETINACMEIAYKGKLGYIPTGTVNDFSKSIKMETNLDRLLDNFNTEIHFQSIDVGKLNERYFVYVAAFGSVSEVSYSTPQNTKNSIGKVAYILEGLKKLTRQDKIHMRIEYDDGIIEDDFCLGLITNSLFIGGMNFFKEDEISLDDGYFECIFIKYPKGPITLNQTLFDITTRNFENTDKMYAFKTKTLRITSKKKVKWTVDGEYGGTYKDATITNYQKAITILK